MPDSLRDLPILDCHIHYSHPNLMPGLIQELDQNRIGRFNLVCTPHRTRLSLVPDALHLKAHYPQRAYVFGGLDISPLFTDPENCGAHFARYVDTLMAMGCDGVKMIEGKPEMRKMLPTPPFDSPAYEPYWAKLEETGLPLLFHVNDPEEFWDPQRIPAWAKERGWDYNDGTFINNETQYTEVLHVMERHPGIRVIFAHFFFFSAQLERLAGYFERFPNLHVDLTPGIEMYQHFAENPQQARDFFIRYPDRILYGTDIGAQALLAAPGAGIDPQESAVRVELVRKQLELDGPFHLQGATGFLFGKFGGAFQGLNLPEDVLRKIYCQNFERLAGVQPRSLNPAAIVAECRRLQAIIPVMGAVQPGQPGDTSVVEQVQSYFESSLS